MPSRPTNTSPARLVPVADVAERLGVTPKTIRRLIAAGVLPGYRVGPRMLRVDPADVERIIARIPTAGSDTRWVAP